MRLIRYSRFFQIVLVGLLFSLTAFSQDKTKQYQVFERTMRVFDVQDLTCLGYQEEPQDKMHEIKLEELMKQAGTQTEELARIIKTFLTPALDPELDSVSAPRPGFLLFEGQKAQEDWIRTFLATQRKAGEVQFLIDLKIYSLSPEAYRKLNVVPGPKNSRVVSPEDAKEIVDRLNLEKGVGLMSAPRICALNRQKATMSVSEQIQYIKDYKVYENVYPDNRRIVAPIIDTVEEGLSFEMLTVLLEEDRIALDFKVAEKRIEKPIPTVWVKVEETAGQTAKPVVNILVVESKAVLSDGTTLILASTAHDGRHQVQFLTVTRLTEEALSTLSKEED